MPPGPAAKSNRLKRCDDGTLSALYVDKARGLAGKIVLVGGDCYEVIIEDSDTPGATVPDRVFSYCLACESSKVWYRLRRCDDGAETVYWVHKPEYIAGGGELRPVYNSALVGCLYVDKTISTTAPPGAGLVVTAPRLADCAAAECAGPCACEGTDPTSAIADVDGCIGTSTGGGVPLFDVSGCNLYGTDCGWDYVLSLNTATCEWELNVTDTINSNALIFLGTRPKSAGAFGAYAKVGGSAAFGNVL
jgi:hypothetical protein